MKNKIVIIFLSFTTVFAYSCNSEVKTSKAIITQRKCLNDTLLRINYKYEALGKTYEDSIEMKNKIISSDSFSIIFSNDNPKRHTPQMQ
jgi:hypothetical protein